MSRCHPRWYRVVDAYSSPLCGGVWVNLHLPDCVMPTAWLPGPPLELNRIGKGRVGGICTRAVHAFGNGPSLQDINASGLQQFDAGLTGNPRLEILLLEDYGHSIMNFGHKGIG